MATPWGTADVRSRCTGSSRSPTPWPRPPRHCGADRRSTGWWRPSGGRRIAATYGGAEDSGRPCPAGRLLQRQPGIDRGGAALHGGIARRAQGRPPRADGRAGIGHRGRARRMARWPRTSGSRSWATRPRSTGPPRRPASTTPWLFCSALGPGDAALVKGSRVARLEDVVQRYTDATGPGSPQSRSSETERADTPRAARRRRAPGGTARRRAIRCGPRASRPGRARQCGAGSPATRGGGGRRPLPPPRPAWPPGTAPRCRARRAGPSPVPIGQGRSARVGGERGHQAGGVDEQAATRPPCPSASHHA